MRRMRKIRSVSGEDNALVAEAGVILSDVHDAAEAADRFFPLSLAAKVSATVGGLVSTNGGGVQVLRYGTMRALILGLETVLADGSVHHGRILRRMDNRTNDMKHLLIRTESPMGGDTGAHIESGNVLCRTRQCQ